MLHWVQSVESGHFGTNIINYVVLSFVAGGFPLLGGSKKYQNYRKPNTLKGERFIYCVPGVSTIGAAFTEYQTL